MIQLNMVGGEMVATPAAPSGKNSKGAPSHVKDGSGSASRKRFGVACAVQVVAGLLHISGVFLLDGSGDDSLVKFSSLVFVLSILVIAGLWATSRPRLKDSPASGSESGAPTQHAAPGASNGYQKPSSDAGECQSSEASTACTSGDKVARPEENAELGSLIIGPDATMIEGLRALLAHHLRRSGVVCLSESQAELLVHHLSRLASYSQKIVHTISFAQRVFNQAKTEEQVESAPPPTGHSKLPPSQEEYAESNEPAAPAKRKKPLRLDDTEILKMYSHAQQEAQLEADWRGSRPEEGDLMQFRNESSDISQQRERVEAIQLLSQAFAVRNSDARAEGIVEVLVPARRCDDQAFQENTLPCCKPNFQGGPDMV
jgi:hypothetical protein